MPSVWPRVVRLRRQRREITAFHLIADPVRVRYLDLLTRYERDQPPPVRHEQDTSPAAESPIGYVR